MPAGSSSDLPRVLCRSSSLSGVAALRPVTPLGPLTPDIPDTRVAVAVSPDTLVTPAVAAVSSSAESAAAGMLSSVLGRARSLAGRSASNAVQISAHKDYTVGRKNGATDSRS